MAATLDVDGTGADEPESALLRYWRAQPGSARLWIGATLGCAGGLPLTGLFPEHFGTLRPIAAGAFIGFDFAMLPIAYRIWN